MRCLTVYLATAGADGRLEHVTRLHVEAWDPNCRLHIGPRLDEEEVQEIVEPRDDRIAELQAENDALKAQIRVGVA